MKIIVARSATELNMISYLTIWTTYVSTDSSTTKETKATFRLH